MYYIKIFILCIRDVPRFAECSGGWEDGGAEPKVKSFDS